MAIKLGPTIINKKLLGVNSLNKIMLGALEIFPNISTEPPGDFDPSDWFVNGEEGLYYNFNEISSLFQTVLGMEPVTAAAQPIGVSLDLSQKLTLGPEMLSNTDFDTGWTMQNANATVVGTELVVNQPTGRSNLCQHPVSPTWISGSTYEITFVISAYTSGSISATDVGNGQVPIGVSGVGTHKQYLQCIRADFPNTRLGAGPTGFIGTVASVSIKRIDSITTTQATAGARPQFNTVGDAMGAIFDGVDDGMLTPVIDMTGVQKVTVMAVILRNSNSRGMAYEYTPNATNDVYGSFGLRCPESGVQQWRWEMGMGVSQFRWSTDVYSTPQFAIATCVYDGVPADTASRVKPTLNDIAIPLGVGGANGPPNTVFPNDILYIGRRGGVSVPANMSLGALVMIGRELTSAEITEGVEFFKNIFGAMTP